MGGGLQRIVEMSRNSFSTEVKDDGQMADTSGVETKCCLLGSIIFLRKDGNQSFVYHSSPNNDLWAPNLKCGENYILTKI